MSVGYKQAVFYSLMMLSLWPLTLPGLNEHSLFIVAGPLLLLISVPFFFMQLNDREINKYLIPLLLIVLITMFYRGIGFAALGASGYGSYAYLWVITSLLALCFSECINPDIANLRKITIYILIGAILINSIQTLSEIGMIGLPPFILPPRLIDPYEYIFSSFGHYRVFNLQFLAYYGLLLLLLLRQHNAISKREMVIFPLLVCIAALSGYRIIVLRIFVLMLFVIAFSSCTFKVKKLQILAIILLLPVSIAIFYLIYQRMPDVVIRAFSWFPGIDSIDADNTTSWRIEVWRLALKYEVPRYLWIGKGLTKTYSNTANVSGVPDIYTWALDSQNYHQGILCILIGFGLVALIFFALLHLTIVKRAIHAIYTCCNKGSVESRVFLSTFASAYLVSLIFFIFLYGDYTTSFADLNQNAALFLICFKNLELIRK